jgi:hypothetical protein
VCQNGCKDIIVRLYVPQKLACGAMQTIPSKENRSMQNLGTSDECKPHLKLATDVARTKLSGRSFHIGTKSLEKKVHHGCPQTRT